MYKAMAFALLKAGVATKEQAGKGSLFNAGWNAKLSYKTHQQLVAQGIM